jgi:HK97 gp10 family phage protein
MANTPTRISTTSKAFKWEGVPEMKKMFAEMAIALGPDGMGTARGQLKDILMTPAMVIRDEAKDMVPVRTGRLRDAIFAARGPDDRRGVIVGVNGSKAPYARMVEKGTSRTPAHPYFRPAINAVAPTIANMIAGDMKKLIEGMAEQLGYHIPMPSDP